MLNVLFAADFPIPKTGIQSTASSILSEDVWGSVRLFSDQVLSIQGVAARSTDKLGFDKVDLVFTHAEYSGLPGLQRRFPQAIFHVGDWPLRHWSSVRRFQPIKGSMGNFRARFRLGRINRSTRLAFVTHEDWADAVANGFFRALHLPIGVKPPQGLLADRIDMQSICFSGNFRYQPNRDAALRLIKLIKTHFPKIRLVLVGFYAEDFAQQVGHNAEIHADVASVTEFLALRRPLYVSLIETGAGAKNKILEAMVAGCPIICTPASLDASIAEAPSIKIGFGDAEIVSHLHQWIFETNHSDLKEACDKLATDTRAQRSWRAVAKMTCKQIATL